MDGDDCTPSCCMYSFEIPKDEQTTLPQARNGAVLDQRAAAAILYIPSCHLAAWQTRLVALHPGGFGDDLEANLHVVYLIDGPGVVLKEPNLRVHYTALSYTWGPQIYRRLLRINDSAFPITDNLYRALQRLRNPRSIVYVWVDAICINQYDSAEKSLQIKNMLLIFRKADQVRVWLGEHSKHSRTLLRFLGSDICDGSIGDGGVEAKALAKRPLGHGRLSRSNTWQTDGSMDGVEDDEPSGPPKGFKVKGRTNTLKLGSPLQFCSSHAQMHHSGLAEIASRPWFGRIWVKQEIWAADAESLLMQCGEDSLDWYVFRRIAPFARMLDKAGVSTRALSQQVEQLMAGLRTSSDYDRLNNHFDDVENPFLLETELSSKSWSSDAETASPEKHYHVDIVNVLRRSINSLCTNQLDHVYGLLGMSRTCVLDTAESEVPSPSKAVLTIDYNKNAAIVFEDLTRYVIQRDRSLAVLLLNANFGTEVDGLRLPSWVPDWRHVASDNGWLRLFSVLASNLTKKESYRVDMTFSQAGSLPLRGHCIGTLTEEHIVEQARINRKFFEMARTHPALQTMTLGDFRQLKTSLREGKPYHISAPNKADTTILPAEVEFEITRANPFAMDRKVDVITSKHMRLRTATKPATPQEQKRLRFRLLPHREDCSKKSPSPWCANEDPADEYPFRFGTDHVESTWAVPAQAQAGDRLLFVQGVTVALVVRPCHPALTFRYVGPAMILGGSWSGGPPCLPWLHDRRGGDAVNRREKNVAATFDRLRKWMVANLAEPAAETFELG